MADYQYIETTGVVIPDTADTQAQVEQEFRDAFGQDLIVTANTPQGVLIAAEVTARQAVARNNAQLANQINPETAEGVFLDGLWKLTGGGRRAATKSTLAAVAIAGVAGTLVPAGSKAKTAAGDVFVTAGDVTLGVGGTAVVDFIAAEFGPVVAAIGALNSVVSAVLGWETVNNPTAAVPGTLQESDVSSRQRRRNTLALQGTALPLAITSELYDTDGVRSLQFRENPLSVAAVIDTINMAANSIYVCVDGGSDADVAASILRKKSLGCNMNGATSVNVTDAATGQVYAIKFDRPTPVVVFARVTVKNLSAIGDPATLVKTAILDYATGALDGEAGLTVGGSVSPFELAGAVNREAPGLYVQKVEVSLDSVTWQTTELALAINQIAALGTAQIVVVVL